MVDGMQNFFLNFREASPGRGRQPQAVWPPPPNIAADLADADFRRLRAQTDADGVPLEFLEERRDRHALNGADVVDQPFIIFRLRAERLAVSRVSAKLATRSLLVKRCTFSRARSNSSRRRG